MAFDIYQAVTDRIISQLEAGTIPWRKPWVCTGQPSNMAISHSTGNPYSLLNQMLLGKPGEYLTFNQCAKAGGKVKKGEKSSIVVFWKLLEKEDEETGEKVKIPLLHYYNVFRLDQCEGIKPRKAEPLPETPANADEQAEQIIADYLHRSGVTIQQGASDRAYYSPATDSITLPAREQFRETAEYYGTVFHELAHSTGHKSRLDRLDKVAHFGDDSYSKEELIAEIGSAALVNHVGLETVDSFRNSAAYVQSWLKALKGDKRLIVGASSKAEKAAGLILGL